MLNADHRAQNTVRVALADFPALETMIFDMEFSLLEPYAPSAERTQGPTDVMYAFYQTQYRWIRRFISPTGSPSTPTSTSARRAPALRKVYFGEFQGVPGHIDSVNGVIKGRKNAYQKAGAVTSVTVEERYAAKLKATSSATGAVGGSTEGPVPSPASPGVVGGGGGGPSGRANENGPNPSMSSGQRIVPGMWWGIAGTLVTRGWADD